MYINTALFTLLRVSAQRGYPEGVLIHFVSRVNKIRVQMSYLHLDPHFVFFAHEMYLYSLKMPPSGLQNVGV
jgi:hypothetical protein